MVILMVAIIALAAIIMGSGNALLLIRSHAEIAQGSIPAVAMLMPMQLASGIARSMSPAESAVAGVAGVSPFELVKRTAVLWLVH